MAESWSWGLHNSSESPDLETEGRIAVRRLVHIEGK